MKTAEVMNVFLFEGQFEEPILAGRKLTTIRARRKDGKPRAKAGEMASLRVWIGKPYRSKQREIAQRLVEFTYVVWIDEGGMTNHVDGLTRRLLHKQVAKADGFRDWRAMKAWFEAHHGLPFNGELVKFSGP